jgi:hypothetical protein
MAAYINSAHSHNSIKIRVQTKSPHKNSKAPQDFSRRAFAYFNCCFGYLFGTEWQVETKGDITPGVIHSKGWVLLAVTARP